MNNKVNFLRGTSAEYEASTKDNDTFYYTTDTKKLYLGGTEITGIEIDDTSTTATDKTWSAKKINENDEQARTALGAHEGNADIHVTAAEKTSWNGKAELSDIPSTLPANGGNADTVGNLPASSFLGSNTKFNYHWINGSSIKAISIIKEEGHLFAFNFTDTPTDYGFIDISTFDGEGFSPAAFGLVRQVWTDWSNPSERFVRIYKATSETDGVWTDWSRCNAASVGAYTEAKLAELEARIAALEGGTT